MAGQVAAQRCGRGPEVQANEILWVRLTVCCCWLGGWRCGRRRRRARAAAAVVGRLMLSRAGPLIGT